MRRRNVHPHLSAGLILLAVVMPTMAGLLLDDGPRWYYVAQAALVAGALAMFWPGAARAERVALGLGMAIQAASMGCGVFVDSGACIEPGKPGPALLATLASISTAAALVSEWRHG